MSDVAVAVQNSEHSTLDFLRDIEPFSELPEGALAAVVEISDYREYAAGETIYSPGQCDGSEILIVVDGSLKAMSADLETGAMMIDAIVAGCIFGIASAVADAQDAQADRLTLTAETDASVIAVQSAAFRSVVAQRPSLTRTLMQYFAAQLAGASFQVVEQETAPETRVYAALLEYIERDAVTAQWRIGKMPKHRELSEKTGADESVVASAVADL
ncbi:MAG: Crp/Fnr family transcriptional regulator, partial [Pseudomonadota bacterium]